MSKQSKRFVDTTATIQVIGSVYANPTFLENSNLIDDDFPNDLHKALFGILYQLYHIHGITAMSEDIILDYLENKPKMTAFMKTNDGLSFLNKAKEVAEPGGFNLYHSRLKKMTLLREYAAAGIDVSFIYDDNNILDLKKRAKQDDWLNNASLVDISDAIDKRVTRVKNKYLFEEGDESCQAGEGILNLIEEFELNPSFGVPFYDETFTTITMGARLGKFYLRSAATGLGKTRMLAQDAAFTACNRYYNSEYGGWINNNQSEPTLFIATEQDRAEIQSLLLSFVSEVDEYHIITGQYEAGERDRVLEAARIIQNSPLYLEFLPDFSLEDIERRIKYNITENNVSYIFFDYIQSTLKILSEISSAARINNLREDNILALLCTKLKEIAVKYNVFISSATQLSGDLDTNTPDQRLLRGAKSIGDKLDFGCHILPINERDRDALSNLQTFFQGGEYPTVKLAIYKNRRGKENNIYLFGYKRLGICRMDFIIATDWQYNLIDIPKTKINTIEGAF